MIGNIIKFIEERMKNFLFKYLVVVGLIAFGFLGGVLFSKRTSVPKAELTQCQEDFIAAADAAGAYKQKLKECVIFVNGLLTGKELQ
jgi:hypothetical protein